MATAEDLEHVPGPPLIGGRIRELRKRCNLTQVELAMRVGIQQSDLSRIENGEYRVSLDTLFRLLRVFDLTIGQFFDQLATSRGLGGLDPVLVERLRDLSEEGRGEVLDFVEFIRRKERASGDPK